MNRGYAIIRKEQIATWFYTGRGWTLDPMCARIYGTWLVAKARVLNLKSAEVAPAWE